MSKINKKNSLYMEKKDFKTKVESYRDLNRFAFVSNSGTRYATVGVISEADIESNSPSPSDDGYILEQDLREQLLVSPFIQEDVLKTILENQNKILENQMKMQERLESLEKTVKDTITDNGNVVGKSRYGKDCKVILEKLQDSVMRLTGEDDNDLTLEIAASFPLSSIDAALDVEENLENPEYLQAMKAYLFQLKGRDRSVDSVFKHLMTDELIDLFNFEGRKEKRALVDLSLINKLLSDVFAGEGRLSFERQMKKSVELSHNRLKQRNRAKRKNLKPYKFKSSSKISKSSAVKKLISHQTQKF